MYTYFIKHIFNILKINPYSVHTVRTIDMNIIYTNTKINSTALMQIKIHSTFIILKNTLFFIKGWCQVKYRPSNLDLKHIKAFYISQNVSCK